MQSGSEPEDIQTILSRFHTWAGKNPGPGNGKNSVPEAGGVREIGYEEAMRNYRQRHKTQPRRVAGNAAAVPRISTTPSAPSEPGPPIPEEAREVPVPATLAPDLDMPCSAPPHPQPESTALARRSPAAGAATAPALATRRTVVRKKAAAPPRQAIAQPQLPAVAPALPRAVHAQPKAAASPKAKSRRGVPTKKSVALALRAPAAPPKKPEFKRVLAKTVQAAPTPAPALRKSGLAPDRDRRITTRFSAAEQRRVERAAAQSGLTVSAWLRQCALLAEAAYAPPPAPAPPPKTTRRALPAPPAEPTLFAAPAPSGLGNWLSLLRQRFLSSPARFSERA